MGWQITGRARVNPESPHAFAVCDRCQFLYNRKDLSWQYEWQFLKVHNRKILVCPTCHDKMQEQLKRIVLPNDPIPIANPRVGEYGFMAISSNPNAFDSIVPSDLATQGNTDQFGNITNQDILVTELSCMPILTEVTDTPLPYGDHDGGYTGGPDANTPDLNNLLGGNST